MLHIPIRASVRRPGVPQRACHLPHGPPELYEPGMLRQEEIEVCRATIAATRRQCAEGWITLAAATARIDRSQSFLAASRHFLAGS